jgi:pimeloyl-ACP methyl ester carboxylesterase
LPVDGITTMVDVGRHRLEVTVAGDGPPAVVIEPSFGGWARDWRAIAEDLAGDTTVVTYDRAPYGASSPARDARTPHDIANDLDGVLEAVGVKGPLVLAGHSAGGVYMRAYAARHMDRVAGMVLVESSHEAQGPVLRPLFSRKVRLRTALTIPQIMAESTQARRGGDRRSIIREWRAFQRVTDGQPMLSHGQLGDRPLIVVTCGPGGGAAGDGVWQAWHGLHQDLARLSANSRHVISESPSHYLNESDPKLLTAVIAEVVSSARTGAPLAEPVAASDGE